MGPAEQPDKENAYITFKRHKDNAMVIVIYLINTCLINNTILSAVQ